MGLKVFFQAAWVYKVHEMEFKVFLRGNTYGVRSANKSDHAFLQNLLLDGYFTAGCQPWTTLCTCAGTKLSRLRQGNTATLGAHGSLLLASLVRFHKRIFLVLAYKELSHADCVVAIFHDLLQVLVIQQIAFREGSQRLPLCSICQHRSGIGDSLLQGLSRL